MKNNHLILAILWVILGILGCANDELREIYFPVLIFFLVLDNLVDWLEERCG